MLGSSIPGKRASCRSDRDAIGGRDTGVEDTTGFDEGKDDEELQQSDGEEWHQDEGEEWHQHEGEEWHQSDGEESLDAEADAFEQMVIAAMRADDSNSHKPRGGWFNKAQVLAAAVLYAKPGIDKSLAQKWSQGSSGAPVADRIWPRELNQDMCRI